MISPAERAPMQASDMVQFMHLLGKLKDIPRTGWTRHAIDRPESVADHSFRVATMAMFFAPQAGVDPTKTTKMLLLHDLGEAIIGDEITDGGDHDLPNLSDKLQRERAGLMEVLDTISATHYIELYDEFVANETPDARFANELDKLEMAMQAREYEMQYDLELGEFYTSAERRIATPMFKQVFEHIIKFEG